MIESWRPGRGWIAVAAAAFAAYLVLDLAVMPLATRFDDEGRFAAEAVTFARTGEFLIWGQRALEMPLIGIVYGVIHKIAGSESGMVAGARILQALLLVVQAWLCADLAQRLFSRAAAGLAFGAVLVYPMFVAFQSFLLSEALFTFFLVLGIWLLYRWAEDPARWRWIVAYAVAMALATYAKASLTALPLILPALAAVGSRAWGHAVRATALVAVVFALCLSPWWLRNAAVFGQPVWFTTSSAAQLYLGNNRANVTGGNDWQSDAEREFVDSTSKLTELERDRRFRERAIEYIKAEPVQFVRNAAIKLVRYWNVLPNHESYRRSRLAWVVALSYGPALVLALIGAWIYRKRWWSLLPVYALVAYFTLLHTVTIASLRYRLPLEPFLVVFAAGAVAHLWSMHGAHGVRASTREEMAR